jgi:subtilisin family serine protease
LTSSTDAGELAVVAKVDDLEAWRGRSEVREGAVLGRQVGGAWLVTARIPLERVEALRSAREVISLKPAQRLRPMLAATIEEIGARVDLLPADAAGEQGRGVVVGIVDFGCDFAHANFRKDDGTTRLLTIWDQRQPPVAGSPFGYGRLFEGAAIDQALTAPDPYAALGYAPPPDAELDSPGTHGTHVMDIAAGNGRGSSVPGVAPQAELIFVELAASDVPWTGAGVVDATFGDSVQLLEAVQFIFERAGDRPCVVNLSLGTNGGPHDGSTLVEQGLDLLVSGAPNRAIVLAAGNAFDDHIHAAGSVPFAGETDLGWLVPPFPSPSPFAPRHNEVEIWYPGGDELRFELLAPGGASLGSIDLGGNGRLLDPNTGETLIFVAHRRGDPNNGDNVIGVFVEGRLPAGIWTLRLHGAQIGDGRFHAWIERSDGRQSSFVGAPDDSHTLGSVSCGRQTIAVGSYDGHKPSVPLSFFSAAGPTRDGRRKPEVSAPGHHVLAAHSRTGSGVVRKSGTSMAAPATAGALALLLAESHARGESLTADQIRDRLIVTARKNPPVEQWHDRHGFGRVDARAMVDQVIRPLVG